MIIFENVSLSFGEKEVIRDLSFRAEFHEKIAVLGGSGEGKTTILKLILGLYRPDTGRILINGTDITGLSEAELREIRMNFSIVFQEGALFDSLNVYENVAFCLREHSRLKEEEIEAEVRNLLKRVGIEEAIYLMPEELSGGMQRRVAIARSLAACEPKMILYDEPTTGLDPLTAETICDLINELSEGTPPERKGFIAVTHKVTDAARIAERFIFIKDGKIDFDGNLDAMLNTDNETFRHFIGELLLLRENNVRP